MTDKYDIELAWTYTNEYPIETQQDIAQGIVDFLKDEDFYMEGRRNDDAVDLCICAELLSRNPLDVFKEIYRARWSLEEVSIQTMDIDIDDFLERKAAIDNYIGHWKKHGVLTYLVRPYAKVISNLRERC